MRAARLLVTVASLILASAGRAHALHPDEVVPPPLWNGRAVALPAFICRSGDWAAAGALGLVAVTPRPGGGYVVVASRAEVGVGGASMAVGVGAIIADRPTPLNEAVMAGGLMTLEARVTRMYGPTSWRSSEYAGLQGSLAIPYGMMRLAVGRMINLRDHADRRYQFGLGVLF